MLGPWKKSYDQTRQHNKKQRHYFASKGPSSQSYGFSNSHVWMWVLDYKESWMPNNWCFWIVVLKNLESPLDCKEIQPKGKQSWIFIGRTDTEPETPKLWPPDVKNWLIWKRPWCWERLKAGGEGDDWGWDGWVASQTQWTWVWVSSGSWWWTGRPGVLQCMGSQRVYHSQRVAQKSWEQSERVAQFDWATELNWTEQEPAYQCRGCKRRGLIPALRRSSGKVNACPLQYSCLEGLLCPTEETVGQ